MTSAQRCDVVGAVHQHLGLDDRHQAAFHADGGVARERMGVGIDAGVARDAGADVDHGAPLGKLGAELDILLDALGQSVETLGHDLALAELQRLGAAVDLDAGQRAGIG